MTAVTEMSPFIVYALPRSRTAWLAQFLSYGGASCGHEQAIFMRDVEDIRAYFAEPMTGAVETAAAQGWRLVHHLVPKLRAAVVRRPVDEVVQSVLATDLHGVARYDVDRLKSVMVYGDRMLAQIAAQPGVLEIGFSDLSTRAGCAAIFEHCLPFRFDAAWWESIKEENIQANVPAVIRYYQTHRLAVERFKSDCRRELWRLRRLGAISSARQGGVTCHH